VPAKILSDAAVSTFDVACKHPECCHSFCLRAGRNIVWHLGMTAESHSASSSSISCVTAELNSDTGVWSVTYSVSHAVQRTPVSRISQVWLPQLQVYRSAIKYLLQECDALHHHQSRQRPALLPTAAQACASILLTVDDGQTVGDLERHTSPFEVELTNRLMGGHRTSRPNAGVSFRRCRVEEDSVFSLPARHKLYSFPSSDAVIHVTTPCESLRLRSGQPLPWLPRSSESCSAEVFSTANSFCGNKLCAATIFAEHPQKADNGCRGMGILHRTPEVEP